MNILAIENDVNRHLFFLFLRNKKGLLLYAIICSLKRDWSIVWILWINFPGHLSIIFSILRSKKGLLLYGNICSLKRDWSIVWILWINFVTCCGNWFALSRCHICTLCSKYWPLLSIERILILYCDLNGWTCAPSRSSSVRMVRWPAWAVSLFVCKQLSPFKILISGWAFKVKVHLWPLIKHYKNLSRKHSVIQKCLV